MPVREIKTTLSLDGEKQFKKELEDANRQMRVMNADLKAMAAAFENTDESQRDYTRRSELLNSKVKQQEEIVRALTRAVEDSANKYGDAAAQTDGYRIKLSNASAALEKMRKEAAEAERELEELGRNSNRIGRQIENGIGDAAENVSDKLDGMFAKVAGDVNALKGSVAFQATMSVGEFVVDGISGVMDFVNENQELNRSIAIARHNIEQYNFKWEDVQDLIIRASAITGNQEGAFEAISNLAGAGFDNMDLFAAATQALLGAYIQTGGALSFESLAEDFRASVVSRVPTGTYAEVLEEVLKGITIEEVEKAFQEVENDRAAIELALSYLTEGGMQTTTIDFEEKNRELIENQQKATELALKWAELANEITPVVTGLLDGTITLVDGLTQIIQFMKGAEEVFGMSREDFVAESQKKTGGAIGTGPDTGIFRTDFREAFTNILNALIPSAGAEGQTDWGPYGENIITSVESGMMKEAEESSAGQDAANAIVDGMTGADENARTAGKNMTTMLANGVAEGAPNAINNVVDMVNQINGALNQIAVPAYSWGGIGGLSVGASGGGSAGASAVLEIDGQTAGRLLYSGISSAGGRAVQSTMLVK